MGIDPITSGISAVGGLMGSAKGAKSQQQAANAASQASQAQTQLYQAEAGNIDQLMQEYFGTTVPIENSLAPQLQSGATGTMTNPYASSAATTIGQLQNFQGLKPQELAALRSTLGQAGMSTIDTLKGSIGGYANPNAVIQSLMNSNNQNAANSTIQLGSMGAQQELGALQEAGGLGATLSGQNVSYNQNNLAGLLQMLGMQTGLVGTGMSGMNSIAGGYGAAGANAANTAASYGNPWTSGIGNLAAQLPNIFPNAGGGGNYTAPAQIGNLQPQMSGMPTQMAA